MIHTTKMIFFAIALFIGTTAIPTTTTTPFKEHSNNKLRHRLLDERETVVGCIKFENNTCECPGGCMKYNENRSTPGCVLNNCWEWDIDKTECMENGPNFISAIVLQGIPFTGIFGAGFGNMGRWDLCGIAVAICFGPLVILFIWTCCLIFLSSTNENNENYTAKCIGNCFGCIWGTVILGWYIYGIVVIANKQIKAPNGCPLH